jgi:hypothetical protein
MTLIVTPHNKTYNNFMEWHMDTHQYSVKYISVWCDVMPLFQYASTIVTYMIVLVQFDQADHTRDN